MGAVLRVVPAEPARHDGLCVTAVALHERGFELHWHLLLEGEFPPDEDDTYGFDASDDLGTGYPSFDSGGSTSTQYGGRYAVIGHSTCRAGVPDGASELSVAKGDARWRIPLG